MDGGLSLKATNNPSYYNTLESIMVLHDNIIVLSLLFYFNSTQRVIVAGNSLLHRNNSPGRSSLDK